MRGHDLLYTRTFWSRNRFCTDVLKTRNLTGLRWVGDGQDWRGRRQTTRSTRPSGTCSLTLSTRDRAWARRWWSTWSGRCCAATSRTSRSLRTHKVTSRCLVSLNHVQTRSSCTDDKLDNRSGGFLPQLGV